MKTIFERIYHQRCFSLVIIASYLILFGIFAYIVDHYDKDEISVILQIYVPRMLHINFFFLLIGILICSKDILAAFIALGKRRAILLAAGVLLGFWLVSFAAPRTHRIFFDEDIYANIAQNIASADKAGYCNYGTFEYGEYQPLWIAYNKQPSGWPFLVSIAFLLGGTDEVYAFLLNNLLF